jgi:AcrR family transcriptional regulator
LARQRDHKKEEAVYDAALNLVMTHGFQGLVMADVAAMAGISTGSIYTYFEDKSDLVNQLYVRLKREKVGVMMRGYKADASFFENFFRIWKIYFKHTLEFPQQNLFLEQYFNSPLLSAYSLRESEVLLQPLISLIEKAVADKILLENYPELILQFIMGSTQEQARFFLSARREPNTHEIERCFRMIWNGIRN